MSLTAEQLRVVLSYDPETGEFVRLTGRYAGQRAGCVHSRGYVHIRVHGKEYKAHRLAWLYMKGQWPEGIVDHIDRCRSNNRWNNLRLATQSQNRVNTKLYDSNSSGHRGVTRHSKNDRWVAQISLQGRNRYLGSFRTREEAARAYTQAASRYHPEFRPA